MPVLPRVAILNDLLPDGVEYGTNLLVEFEPTSIWFETSFTIAAEALRKGIKTTYHTWTRPPSKVRDIISNLSGLNLRKLEEQDLFRVNDSYTAQMGFDVTSSSTERVQPLKVSELSIEATKIIKHTPEAEKRWLHIDDNDTVLVQYNDEKSVTDYYRTRIIPECKARELAAIHSIAMGVHSESFYKQFELFCDGIIDFRSEQRRGEIEHLVRTRLLRGKSWNSKWRKLTISRDGLVTIASES